MRNCVETKTEVDEGVQAHLPTGERTLARGWAEMKVGPENWTRKWEQLWALAKDSDHIVIQDFK